MGSVHERRKNARKYKGYRIQTNSKGSRMVSNSQLSLRMTTLKGVCSLVGSSNDSLYKIGIRACRQFGPHHKGITIENNKCMAIRMSG
jgi:hypothetical protein